LPAFDLCSFAADNNGNIWFTTQRSISQLNVYTGKITRLTEIDGFTKQDFSRGACAFTDVVGDVYFMSGIAGSQGFTRVKPDNLALHYPPANVYIQALEVNQAGIPSKAPKTAPSSNP